MPRMLNYYVELVNLMVKNNRSQNMSQAKLQKYLKQCLFPVHSGVHVFLSKWSSGSRPFLLGKPRLVSGKIRTFSQFCRWNCQMLPFFQGAHGLNSLNIPKNPWDVELQGSCWEILGVWKFIFFHYLLKNPAEYPQAMDQISPPEHIWLRSSGRRHPGHLPPLSWHLRWPWAWEEPVEVASCGCQLLGKNMGTFSEFIWLVVSTPLKNISQLGWLFPIYGKIKMFPNHQPVIYDLWGVSFFGIHLELSCVFFNGCLPFSTAI